MTVAEDKLPDEATVTAIREKLIADAIQEILDGKDAVVEPITQDGETYKIGDYTVTKEFAEAVKTTKVTVFSALLEKNNTFKVEDGRYSANSAMHEWLFADRDVNDIDKFYEGDGAEGEVTDENGTFSASAAIVVTPRYRDESLSKNFTYLIFSTEAEAKAAIEKFEEGEISVDAFKALANEYTTATCDSYEGYTKGALGVSAFDDWMFADDTEVGAYTKTPLSNEAEASSADEVSYIIAYYSGDGEPAWTIYVKSAIFYDKYEEFYTALPDAYEIKVRDRALSKIG